MDKPNNTSLHNSYSSLFDRLEIDCKKVLATWEMLERHTGIHIAQHNIIQEISNEQVVAIVHDNAANMAVAIMT